MANLEETAVWTPGVYQLETTDPVLGGPVQPEPATGGIANRAALALANRTTYLKAQVELKANTNSPTFTGNPRAPTHAVADDSTKLATTAHVKAVLTQGYAQKSHTHTWEEVTGKPVAATRWPQWGEVTEKPTDLVTQNMYSQSLGTTGWMKRPDGIIEQWGLYVNHTLGEVSHAITFPTAFPNACLNVLVCEANPDNGAVPKNYYDAGTQANMDSLSKTGFSLFVQNHGSSNPYWHGAFWRAIGH